MSATDFYQSVIQAVWLNNERKPLNDPRVRRAMHLVLDRHVLVDVVRDVAPMLVGGFIYPFSEWATPVEELSKWPGYQHDAKASIHEALNVETKLRTVQVSAWFEEAQGGNFDLRISAVVSTLMDPSDYFSAWYRTDGPQNYSRWSNQEFDGLVKQIDRETDDAKRKAIVHQAAQIMERDPPVLPVFWEKIYDGWYNYVKGVNPYHIFGIYDVVRWDTAWLDK